MSPWCTTYYTDVHCVGISTMHWYCCIEHNHTQTCTNERCGPRHDAVQVCWSCRVVRVQCQKYTPTKLGAPCAASFVAIDACNASMLLSTTTTRVRVQHKVRTTRTQALTQTCCSLTPRNTGCPLCSSSELFRRGGFAHDGEQHNILGAGTPDMVRRERERE